MNRIEKLRDEYRDIVEERKEYPFTIEDLNEVMFLSNGCASQAVIFALQCGYAAGYKAASKDGE